MKTNDLADVDTRYRCVMKEPKKKYILHEDHCFMHYYQGVFDGIGATRSSSALRRVGFRSTCFRFPTFGYFFSIP